MKKLLLVVVGLLVALSLGTSLAQAQEAPPACLYADECDVPPANPPAADPPKINGVSVPSNAPKAAGPSNDGGGLPFTGSDILIIALIGAVLVGGGITARQISKRRAAGV